MILTVQPFKALTVSQNRPKRRLTQKTTHFSINIFIEKQPGDKCSSAFLNVGQFPNNGNIRVGFYNYLIFPAYNFNIYRCDMGTTVTGFCGTCKTGSSLFAGINYSRSAGPSHSINSTAGEQSSLYEGPYTLTMKSDRNLVFYHGANPIWASNSQSGATPNGYWQAYQTQDGNLNIYDGSAPTKVLQKSISNFAGTSYQNYCTVVQVDGNLVMYNANCGPRWATGTYGQ